MTSQPTYIDVILPLKHGVFTYELPDSFTAPALGFTVVVPLGKNLYSGIVVAVHSKKPEFKTRPLAFIPKRNPTATLYQLKFWNWIAGYYLCSLGEVADASLPSILKIKSEATVVLTDNFELLCSQDFHYSVASFLKSNKGVTINQLIPLIGADEPLGKIHSMLENGFIEFDTEEEKYKPLVEKKYRVNLDLVETAMIEFSRAKKKTMVLDFLVAHHDCSFTVAELSTETGCSVSIVKSVTGTPYIMEEISEISRFGPDGSHLDIDIQFSEYQLTAFNSIRDSLIHNKPVLLQGVTGSGKTEIYIKLIEETLQQGKQVLYLLPEIVLSSQIIKRLQIYFGQKVCIYHSRINQSERAEIWYSILRGERFGIVVGPRSAIFLPYKNLGLVIVDEEHDPGYKQQEPAPRYNARDAAIVLAQMMNASLVLGSATPSLESLQNVKVEKYLHVALKQRYGNSPLPVVEVVDYRKWYRRHEVVGHLTPQLKSAMEKAFESGEQVILLQNRRGFAPFVQCPSCGHIPQCKNCDISLTVHKFSNRLVCHYCGFSVRMPESCPKCAHPELRFQGFGTEKVEEELTAIFPDKIVARLDSDTARSKKNLEEVMSNFTEGKIDILVGTQMVSKGLDFGGVNLVGVLNADNMLSFPDFRSHERGYQMLMQFAGRAGRREQQGKVIIQTSQLEHPVIVALHSGETAQFLETLLKERLTFHYPPFTRLIQLTVKHSSREKTDQAANILLRMLQKSGITNVLGPYVPPIPKIKKQQFSQLMIKLDRNEKLMNYRDKVISSIETVQNLEGYKSVVIIADVDPY
jgi:primosomal protein N' (replication factor Y)